MCYRLTIICIFINMLTVVPDVSGEHPERLIKLRSPNGIPPPEA
jgi:hypothetical protein